jgi:hypothetical protein
VSGTRSMHRGNEKLIETFSWKRLIGRSGYRYHVIKMDLKDTGCDDFHLTDSD